MKRIILSVAIMLSFFSPILAEPVLHVSFDAEVGRQKFDCRKIWICFKNVSGSVEWEGMITKGHGVVIDRDGTLSLAINMDAVKKQDVNKYNELKSGSLILDSEEELPADALKKLGYTGRNVFPAGIYKVTIYQGYFMIRLN